jgi:carbonic anhydrase
LDRIHAGIRRFQEQVFPTRCEHFQSLAQGQRPELLLVTCSDSRIDPGLLTQTQPGEIFVIRNAGNLVPPHREEASAEEATVQYGIEVLGIRHIAVCGHAHCGAMAALREPGAADDLPAVRAWIEHARRALDRKVDLAGIDDPLLETAASNVLTQLDHLRTHPSVRAAQERGALTLHAWLYDFVTGALLVGEANGRFRSLANASERAA